METLTGEALRGSYAMKKQEVLDLVQRLPDQIDPEQLMYELYVKAKLERAEEEIARGDLVNHEDVVKRSQEWFE